MRAFSNSPIIGPGLAQYNPPALHNPSQILQTINNGAREIINYQIENFSFNINGLTTYQPNNSFPKKLGVHPLWSSSLLDNIHFKKCIFIKCDFSHVSMRHASFENVVFENCEFNGTCFDHSTFEKVTFCRGKMTDTSFHAAKFDGVQFKDIDLSYNYSIGLNEKSKTSYDEFQNIGFSHLFGSDDRKDDGLLVLIPWIAYEPSFSISRVIEKVKRLKGIPVRYDYMHILDSDKGYEKINPDDLRRETNAIMAYKFSPAEMIAAIQREPNNYPVINAIVNTAQKYAAAVDRVILPGGADIDPRFYRDERVDEKTKCGALERDWFEMAILSACQKDDSKKMLGICRGMQMIHVWSGGQLLQDYPGFLDKTIDITLTDGTKKRVYDYFHQVPDGPTPGFQITATAQGHNNDKITHMIEKCDGIWVGIISHLECKIPNPPTDEEVEFVSELDELGIFEKFFS